MKHLRSGRHCGAALCQHAAVRAVVPSAGCDVALIDPQFDAAFGVPLPLTAADVAAGLDGLKQRVGAVLVTSPTYEGLCTDISAIAGVRCCSALVSRSQECMLLQI
jgi:arginine/lysine/ornithine decarboxylase